MKINYYLYRLKWWLVDKTGYIPKAPMNIDIELAGKCNLSCTMCPYGTGSFDESKQGMMPKEMAIKTLEEARRLGVKAVKLNFRGEPGLSKHLEFLIGYAKQLGFVDVFINTNFLAFSKQRLRYLAEVNPTKVIVSIDGIGEAYEQIRVGGDYNKLIYNIRYFNKFRKCKLIIQHVGEEPSEEIKSLPSDEYRFVKVQDRGQGAEGNRGERRRCPQPRQRLVVAWDGTIFPCCSNWNNEFPLGNIKDITLKSAWTNKRMKEIREISEKCDAFPCKNCQVAGSYK